MSINTELEQKTPAAVSNTRQSVFGRSAKAASSPQAFSVRVCVFFFLLCTQHLNQAPFCLLGGG